MCSPRRDDSSLAGALHPLGDASLNGSFIPASGRASYLQPAHGRRQEGVDVIKMMLVCDGCSAVIADGTRASAMRLEAQALYRREGGKDLCLTCEPIVHADPTPEAERSSRPDPAALAGPTSEGDRKWLSGLLFTCPKTGQPAPTGIETDVQSLRALWRRTLKLDCPHCGEVHEFTVREAYLNSALKHAGSDRDKPKASRSQPARKPNARSHAPNNTGAEHMRRICRLPDRRHENKNPADGGVLPIR